MSGRPDDAAIIVTGAARGIGAASVQELAADGWAVAVLHRNGRGDAEALVQQIVDAGGRAVPIRADLREPAEVEQAFDTAQQELGPVLGLVNNAGVRADNLALTAPYPVGTTKITCVATDSQGNTDTCSFNVIVKDCEAPTYRVKACSATCCR